MRIFIQDPTKGPPITVSFDDGDGASLAFVPAAVDCGAKYGVVAAGGAAGAPVIATAAAIGALVSGDSPVRVPIPVMPNPIEGINRFAPRASIDAIEDGRTIERTVQSANAVGLPGEGTPTTAADVSPLAGLAAKLKDWDGVAPLEVAGFKFEKVAGTDGKPTIKITISTDNIQDIIDAARTIQSTFPEESHRLTVDITHPNLGRALLRWGHRFFDGIIAEIVATRPQILAMNDKLSRGETLSDGERALVENLRQHILQNSKALVNIRGALDHLFTHPSQESKASQFWAGFLHDMGRRGEHLNNIHLIYTLLRYGETFETRDIERLNQVGKNSLQYAIKYALSLAQTDLQKNHVKTAWHFNGNAEVPVANEEQFDILVDILANLISNAARYSDPKKEKREIHISVRRTDDGIEIEVRDNGIGIPADKLSEIGQFGFRVGEKDVDGSHGHGLWQVQKNLEDLGWGKLQVESTHGAGSIFRFTIPHPEKLPVFL